MVIPNLIFRTAIVYVFLLCALRLMGKRQLGELELSELIVAVLISDLATQPMINRNISVFEGLVPVITLLVIEFVISVMTFHSVKLRRLIFGTPSIIIKDGKIIQKAMRANRVSLDELSEAMRSGGITDISKIRYAILETDGEINFLPYASAQPATPEDMGLSAEDKGLPHIVISRGRIIENNLNICGRSRAWLLREIKRRGADSPEKVYCMSVDDAGNVYFLPNEEKS